MRYVPLHLWSFGVHTSCASPGTADKLPCSGNRLSLGELHPDTGVLLLLGEESAVNREMHVKTWTSKARAQKVRNTVK